MKLSEVSPLLRDCECRIVGCDDLVNEAELEVVAAVLRCYKKRPEVTVFCEPSLARSTSRPPDVVLAHPALGVHVFEVKGYPLHQVEAVRAGEFQVRERGRQRTITPFKQVRAGMFDIKNAVERSIGAQTDIPFLYWVAFPNIERSAWLSRWSKDPFDPPELLFKEDLESGALGKRLEEASRAVFKKIGIVELDPSHMQHVARAFGDSSILYDDRESLPTREGTLGEYFDELAVQEKQLSDEQQRLATQDWRGGPRLVRGVAGSGKTVVLATHMARLVERWHKEQLALFGQPVERRALAVCFNRTLVPFINKKVRDAFRQRTGGDDVPPGAMEVTHINKLMYELSKTGLWEYQSIERGRAEDRARYYLDAVKEEIRRGAPLLETLRYDAIYVDEGQDIVEAEYQVLAALCKPTGVNAEPNLFIFYDDAQNLYGRARPKWKELGLVVSGARSSVMRECFRNTRQIVEPAFNLLLGAVASPEEKVNTKGFADTNDLLEQGVLERDGDYWRVKFAERQGQWPSVFVSDNQAREAEAMVARIRWLVDDEKVRPEDILVLGMRTDRLREIAAAVEKAPGGIKTIRAFEKENKDSCISRKGHVTISTIQSAKGYDAYCVLLASVNELQADVQSRATFYVACTRAREHLDLFAYENSGLMSEYSRILTRLSGK